MSLEITTGVAITEADVAGFAARLEAWYETLPAGEQMLLQRLLACAEGALADECDVEGYALPGMGARLARLFAAGLLTATLATSLTAPQAATAGTIAPTGSHVVVSTPEQIIETK